MEPKRLGKEPIYFKNPNNPSCIDLFLTNTMRNFQETQVFETGLFDFHKLVVKFLKLQELFKRFITRWFTFFAN